jgi:hypothetical protein
MKQLILPKMEIYHLNDHCGGPLIFLKKATKQPFIKIPSLLSSKTAIVTCSRPQIYSPQDYFKLRSPLVQPWRSNGPQPRPKINFAAPKFSKTFHFDGFGRTLDQVVLLVKQYVIGFFPELIVDSTV